jgi:hypothetical protein
MSALVRAAPADPAPGVCTVYLAALNRSPGVVLKVARGVPCRADANPVDRSAGAEPLWVRPNGGLTGFCFMPPPPESAAATGAPALCYASAPYGNCIWRAEGEEEQLAYRSGEMIHSVKVGPGNAVYFSTAYGMARDGAIYRMDAADWPERYCTIQIAQVGGCWAGDFAFSPSGALYIADACEDRAGIWECPRDGAPRRVFRAQHTVKGFCFLSERTVLYTDGTSQVWTRELGSRAGHVFFSDPSHQDQYCDVVVARWRARATAALTPKGPRRVPREAPDPRVVTLGAARRL